MGHAFCRWNESAQFPGTVSDLVRKRRRQPPRPSVNYVRYVAFNRLALLQRMACLCCVSCCGVTEQRPDCFCLLTAVSMSKVKREILGHFVIKKCIRKNCDRLMGGGGGGGGSSSINSSCCYCCCCCYCGGCCITAR